MKTTATAAASIAVKTLMPQLQTPEQESAVQRWRNQSLAKGAAGVALLHIERAHTGAGTWRTAHTWVQATVDAPISAADDTGLYFGVPAIAFVLHLAADGLSRYEPAAAGIDGDVSTLAHRRVDLAEARIGRGERPAFAEYDLLGGLTGIGAHLLQHTPGSDALGRILGYLVRLTTPVPTRDGVLPGWWTHHDPHLGCSPQFPDGHANFGIAHGIAGPLALLAQALRRGITVDRHAEAIDTITAWLDTWRQDTEGGPWWPQWITRDELRTGRPRQRGPLRPSWCYGTPGLARAQQLAALATRSPARQHAAEDALVKCVYDSAQLGQITDTSLCHGWAGLYLTTLRTAVDALTPSVHAVLTTLTDTLVRQGSAGRSVDSGLLEGDAGLALALHTAANPDTPACSWDTCLLIN